MRRHHPLNNADELYMSGSHRQSPPRKRITKHFVTKDEKIFLLIVSFSLCILVPSFFKVSHIENEATSLNNGKHANVEVPQVKALEGLPSMVVMEEPKQQIEDEKMNEPNIHITLSSLGIPETLPKNQFDERRNRTNISIVISYCSESFDWIFNYIDSDRYKIDEIIIYSKCGKGINNTQQYMAIAPTEIITAPNVGRCDHTYATWILNHYKSIQTEKNGDDIVFFVKDNDYHKDQFYTFDELFTFTTETGFGCLEKPVCDCDNEQCNDKKDIALMMHSREKLDNFKMNTHNRMKRDKQSKDSFKNKEYKTLKSWKEDMGFVMSHSETIPVCYGGIFAAKKKQILNQPEQVWRNVVTSLARGNNILEGHYAERLWAPALSVIDEDYTKRVSEAVLPHVYDTFWCWNRLGMLMVPRSKGFNANIFVNLTKNRV